jgi:ribosome biogenesis GTPase
MEGRVFRSTGSWYEVRTEEGQLYNCRLRGKFKQKGLKTNNPIAVGDYVVIDEAKEEQGSAVIIDILPRENYIIRKSTRKTGFAHILASNIDQAIVVATITFPRTSQGFIDRFLVSAESFRIPAIVLINKKDIYTEKDIAKAQRLIDLYNGLGYESHLISAKDEADLALVNTLVKDKTTLISGHSGVGKSTLMNALAPALSLKTGEVSTFANKGTHTTTFAEMFEFEKGSFLIDTPGIKELGLMDMEDYEIGHYFPEMRQYLGECKFNNCLHLNEPGCRIHEAIEDGEIDESRYISYLSILENEDSHR